MKKDNVLFSNLGGTILVTDHMLMVRGKAIPTAGFLSIHVDHKFSLHNWKYPCFVAALFIYGFFFPLFPLFDHKKHGIFSQWELQFAFIFFLLLFLAVTSGLVISYLSSRPTLTVLDKKGNMAVRLTGSKDEILGAARALELSMEKQADNSGCGDRLPW